MTQHTTVAIASKRKSKQLLFWSYQSSFKGSGINYASSRVYVLGDPYHRMDRRTSAKKNELYLKEFEEEKLLKLLVIVPTPKSMAFASVSPSKRETMQSLSALLFESVAAYNDHSGFLIAEEQQQHFQKASSSKKQHWLFDRLLRTISPQWSCSINTCSQLLMQHHIKHHSIIWISDQFPSGEDKQLHALARENDVLWIQLFDPFEVHAELPIWKQLLHLYNKQDKILNLDQKTKEEYKKQFTKRQKEASSLLRSWNITTMMIDSLADPLHSLIQLFVLHKKNRQ